MLRDTRSIADGVNGVLQCEPHLTKQQPEADETASRVEFDFAELEREEDQTSSASSLKSIQ